MGKPAVISLYSGAGGLDYGFEAAGFRTAVALEIDHDSCETLRRNRKWPVIERSVFDVPSDELLDTGNLRKREADVLIAGPPCQPFSKSGYWAKGDAGRLTDPRSDTLGAFMRVLEDALPRTFVLENVEGLAYSKKNEGLQLLLKQVQDINRRTGSNYQPTFRVLKAADYGVPQMRGRFFMVASREGDVFRFPSPTHSANGSEANRTAIGSLPPHRTAWDALADVELDADEDLAVRGKWADLLPSIPEGENYLWHTERGGGLPLFGWRRRYWSFLLKLAKNRPSWTVQAQPGPATGPFHWDNRRLSMRELCRLQTFPDDVVICGGRTSVQKQVGNAVPSLLAEVLGRSIRKQLLGQRVQNRSLKLLPEDRAPAPSAAPTMPVAPKFLDLAGEHTSHPGTGRGYRAADRSRQSVSRP